MPTHEERFQNGLAHFIDHVNATHEPDIVESFVCDDGFPLGNWVHTRRKERGGRLTPEREAQLDDAGMIWDVQQYRKDKHFAFWINLAKIYLQREGDLNVPATHKEQGHCLGGWIAIQRARYRNLPGREPLTDDEVHQLDDLGMIWTPLRGGPSHRKFSPIPTPPRSEPEPTAEEVEVEAELELLSALSPDFLRNIPLLADFKRLHRHTNVPLSFRMNNQNLGEWLEGCRESFRKGTLTTPEIGALKSLCVVWEPQLPAFTCILEELDVYAAANHSGDVPVWYYTARCEALGEWIEQLRVDAENGTLYSVQIEQLHHRGVPWATALIDTQMNGHSVSNGGTGLGLA